MKKTKLLLMFLLVFFASVSMVRAEEKLVCDKTVEVGKTVTCTFTIGEEIRMIETDSEYFKIESVSGNGNTQLNDYQSIFRSSGKIKFIAKKSGNANVYVSSEDGIFSYDELEQMIKITEMKTTTTTTTTTKKKSSNNYLTTIIIDDEQIESFSKDKTKYYVSVANEVKKVNIDARVEDENATYDINGPQLLEVGDNEYTIGVTSEDNTTRFYKVIITRKEEDASSNTNISSIKISGYKFNLDGNSKTYHLKIDEDDDKLNVGVELEDENASYEIEGNSNLQDGSIIKIIITAENGDIDTYRIIISKDEKTNYLTYIIIGISTLVIILLIIFMVFKKNNKKNEKKKDNEISDNEKNNIHKDIEKDVDLEKTIEISSLNDGDGNIDNDENEETRMLSLEENTELEKTKVIELDSETEIDKAFEDTFD